MSSQSISDVVNLTYERFCSRKATTSPLATHSPAHKNLLLRVLDFATVIEAKCAMQAGDTGRLMYMWEQWAVMGQALPKLPHYSRHLPRLILLIKYILPPSLARIIRSTLLISPTGRHNHFVATNFYLEIQNYWLKYFFNHSGIGTDIERLKEVFSINIPILRFLLQMLKTESGANVTHQSHKNHLNTKALNNFIRMAIRESMTEVPGGTYTPDAIPDMYTEGVVKLQKEFTARGLERFKPNSDGIYQLQDELDKMELDLKQIDVLSEHLSSSSNSSVDD
ncbi:hypothetical protein Pst134EA_004670 [Puccinia striiformis f. sp. tritici]|uniref:hypothetical protein n=1 Tax=Puccinia striiformis f. sp. tritici TaxID=168172 RepID=UPI000A12391A|nr:hypothetical protein Pst134EA_004670 [Puccinia striiformis f. sp. tritici]KAH9470746.1 hypothetical protein Pst134EA_004670 [Puccinia striiformis f. sp. tritici]